MDSYLKDALKIVESESRNRPGSRYVGLAFDYLLAVVPGPGPVLDAVLRAKYLVESWDRSLFDSSGVEEFDTVAEAVGEMRRLFEGAAGPSVLRPRTVVELAQAVVAAGLPLDWHEPDEVGVSGVAVLRLTQGVLDNAGNPVLEQTVVVRKGDVPVMEVQVATLLSWACAAGLAALGGEVASETPASGGSDGGPRAWWTLVVSREPGGRHDSGLGGRLGDGDREHVAGQVVEGFTEGELVLDEH